jgi:hypothetical protein
MPYKVGRNGILRAGWQPALGVWVQFMEAGFQRTAG